MTGRFVAGLDLGSTGMKILIADEGGAELLVLQRPTPWRDASGGATELTAGDLIAVLTELFAAAEGELAALLTGPTVAIDAMAVSGMGETGILVDHEGTAAAPGFAWFDPRGRQQADRIPVSLQAEFAGRTGLPLGAQVSVAKVLLLRHEGLSLRGLRWMNLPEYVLTVLGGRAVSEYSLASRTGFLDQDSGQPWEEMLSYLGAGQDFLPPLVDAGTDLGTAAADWLPPMFRGARLTVAGHDHLVSAVSGGAIAHDSLHVSMGTAEVLLRLVNDPIPFAARERLAGSLINSVRHVVPGQYAVVAGVKTGLLMRRALQLCGVSDRAGRDHLDSMAYGLDDAGQPSDGIEARGARNDDGVLSLTVRADGVSPASMFNAVLRHGNDEIELLLKAMNNEIPAARSTLLTGGWAGMKSVQRARSRVLPKVRTSNREQDTAYGAAVFATRLLSEPTTTSAIPRPSTAQTTHP